MSAAQSTPIRIAILEDHPFIVSGYTHQLANHPEIEIVAALEYSNQIDPLLAEKTVDVLLLDLQVPVSPDNSNPYPVFYMVEHLLEIYPDLYILVITMHAERYMIRKLLELGVSGYILKNDRTAHNDLAQIIRSVATGNIYISNQAQQQLYRRDKSQPKLTTRQAMVLSLFAAHPNWSRRQMAEYLSVTSSTVRNTLHMIYVALGVNTLAGAIARAREQGLITPVDTPSLT
jgi:DNA-binding NarL/FixJ family response regulator